MLVSTKGRYALRVLTDLAEHSNGEYIPMKDIAERQELSLKYLSRILPVLTQSRLIEGLHGKGGGYRLTRQPEDYPIGEILRLTEGTIAPIACLAEDAPPCERAAECRTIGMWKELNDLINGYLDNKTIADLMQGDLADNYVI